MKKVIQQRKGFRNQPIPNKAELAKRQRAADFVRDYGELRKKYGIQWSARIAPIATGEMAQVEFYLRDFVEAPKTKPWSEALADNLQTYKDCKHKETDGKTLTCTTCSLKHDDYGEGGKGISKEAQDKMIKRIAEAKAEEKKKADDEAAENEKARKELMGENDGEFDGKVRPVTENEKADAVDKNAGDKPTGAEPKK